MQISRSDAPLVQWEIQTGLQGHGFPWQLIETQIKIEEAGKGLQSVHSLHEVGGQEKRGGGACNICVAQKGLVHNFF